MQPVESEHRYRYEKLSLVFVLKPSFVILENEKGERSRLKSVIETEFARVRSSESPGLGTGCHLGDSKKIRVSDRAGIVFFFRCIRTWVRRFAVLFS